MMRQEGCVKTGCDLGSTGDLGPITDDSRNIGEGIFDRFFDQGNISAYHIGNGSSGCTGGRYRTAEGRQLPYILLLINCEEIGKHQSPVEAVIRQLHLSCIDDQRNRACNSLISASGVDDNRHITATHTCLRSRCSKTSHSGEHIVRIIFTDHAPDTQAVFSGHSLMSNGHIASDLRIQKLLYIGKLYGICKFPNILQI